MQRIYNISEWTKVQEETQLTFENPRPRQVRLEVNAPVKTALMYLDLVDGEVHFLALVEGRDTVEFGSNGAFALTVEGSYCMVRTADGADISQKAVHPQSLVRIAERRRRDPNLERMMQLMQANTNRLLEQQAQDLDRLLSRKLAAAEAERARNAGNVPPQPAPAPSVSGSAEVPNPNGATENDGANS